MIEELKNLQKLLIARAIDLAQKSEGNENKKAWYQAGKADGLHWAAEHLGTILDSYKPLGDAR